MSLFAGARLAVLDTETTGMTPSVGHVLLEVARVDIDDGAPGASWSSLVRPGRPIPHDAIAVHGITEAMVAAAPEPAQVAAELAQGCAGRWLVFHNAAFDLPFLNALMRGAGLARFDQPVIDTLGLARGLLRTGNHSLGSLAAQFGVRVETTHRALGDASSTAQLLLILAPRWQQEQGIRSLAELAAASQDALRSARRSGAREDVLFTH
jgi:DNA polymerase-3 subunit epsilon